MSRRQIVVLDRFLAEEFECERPWACISIVTNAGDWPEIATENRQGLLQLAFADVTQPLAGLSRFDTDQAHDVMDFVGQTWPRIRVLMIHCEAGISRSSAVATAIGRLKRHRPSRRFLRPPYSPNPWVYRTLLEVAAGRADYNGEDDDLQG